MARISEPSDPSRTTEAERHQLEEKGALNSSYADDDQGEIVTVTTDQLLYLDDE